MSAPVIPKTSAINFRYLNTYAGFLLENHLEEFVRWQIDKGYELELPFLKHLSFMTTEEILNVSRQKTAELLALLSKNRIEEQIRDSLKRWISDQLNTVDRYAIIAEDITLICYIRKQALLNFLPHYTNDFQTAIEIVREIDTYILKLESVSTRTFTDVLEKRILDELHFNEKLLDASPSFVFVLDSATQHVLHTNQKLEQLVGHDLDALNKMGSQFIATLVHPEDASGMKEFIKKFENAGETETRTFEFRIKNTSNGYHWLKSYGTVFKRDQDNDMLQILNAAFIIDEEKKYSEELKKREEQLTKTVQQLEYSENLYKQAQAITHIGNYSWNLRTNELEWSDELFRIYGIAPGSVKITYELVASYNHPEDVETTKRSIENCIKTGKPFHFHYRIILSNQQIKVLEANGKAVLDRNNRPCQILGTAQDVTERYELIQKLQYSEGLYKQAQALSNIGNWSWDIEKNTIAWSDELYRIFGLEKHAHLTYEAYLNLLHPDDRENMKKLVQQCLHEHVPYESHHRVIQPGGKIKHLHAKGNVQLDANGRPCLLYGVTQDITQYQALVEQLKQSEDLYKKVTDAIPAVITSYNIHTGKYLFISNGVQNILGYDPKEILEKGTSFFLEKIHPEDAPRLQEESLKGLKQVPLGRKEPVAEFKYRLRHVDGAYRWLQTVATIFDRSEDGNVQNIVNISLDVTDKVETRSKEHAHSEQEFRELKRALDYKTMLLEQSNANVDEFAYIASHDLKEPLRKISSFADRLATKYTSILEGDGKIYIDKIIHSSKRMQGMIQDLLIISRISGDKSFERSSLLELLKDALQMLNSQIEKKNAVIDFSELPEIRVVPSQFKQLFLQLIANALKFSKPDAAPVIKITHRNLAPSEISDRHLAVHKKYLQVDVSDNGIGFDNQHAAKIFTIFQRLHGKYEYEGAGIGLTICKKIVENHEGLIFAHSKPEEGSIFSIIVPYD